MIYEPNTPDSQELVLTFKSHSDRKSCKHMQILG